MMTMKLKASTGQKEETVEKHTNSKQANIRFRDFIVRKVAMIISDIAANEFSRVSLLSC